MLYCPGNGQELLYVLGVTLVCHTSNVFLVLKVPLSINDAFSKSRVWLLDQAWPQFWCFSNVPFFRVLKARPVSPI